jgi:hypothetical protein
MAMERRGVTMCAKCHLTPNCAQITDVKWAGEAKEALHKKYHRELSRVLVILGSIPLAVKAPRET